MTSAYTSHAPPPTPVPAMRKSDDPLVVALMEQTEAINALVALMAPLVEDQGSRLLDAEKLLKRLTERVFSEGLVPSVPGKTTV